jgi:phage terminase large subunit-like protein
MTRQLRPFTLPHFRQWTSDLVLDNGHLWVLEPFQADFVRDFFGGRPENWLLLPEGNAKTTLLAGLGLYHCELVESAWVPVGASSRDQARILYRQAKGFVRRTPRLAAAFRCFDGYRRIVHGATDGTIEIFANDDRTGDGVIPTLALIDELHRHRDMTLYQTWRGKLGKRNGQLIAISTAGEPGSEFEQARERIRQDPTAKTVRKGGLTRVISASVVMHDWAVPESADVEDLRVVKRANPLKAITIDRLREKLTSPTMTMAHWRRFVCNLPTRSDAAAITEAEWATARLERRPAVDVWQAHVAKDTPIWVGLDVAWKWDTTAIVPYWTGPDFGLVGPARILTPPRDGSMLDPHEIERALTELNARNPIHTVVMDPSKAEQLASWIEETFGSTVIARGASPALAVVDYERFMEGLRTGTLKHCGDEGLTQHALNAIARMDRYGATRFDRPNPTRYGGPEQERRVIDALTAAAMVHAQALVEAPVEEAVPTVW